MSKPDSKRAAPRSLPDDEPAPPPQYHSPAPLVPAFEEPPAYREEGEPPADELVPPAGFVLHGCFVHPLPGSGASTIPSSSSSTQSTEPLYELSRAIHTLGRATETIDFQRLDYRVRHDRPLSSSDGGPSTTRRARDLYTLQHRPPLISTPFEAWLTPVASSKRTVGKVKIEKSPLFRPGYRAMKVLSEGERKKLEREKEKEKDKKGKGKSQEPEYHFVIRETGSGVWEWAEPGGRVVGRQWSDKVGDDGEGEVEYKLQVLAPLTRRVLDSLVAMWCLWMWHIHYERTVTKKTWADRKRIMRQPRLVPGAGVY